MNGDVRVVGFAPTLAGVAQEQDAEAGAEYATDGGTISVSATGPEWEQAAQDGGMDVHENTIRNALDDLRDAGLVKEGEYEQDRGRLHTLTELGVRVAAR